MKSTAPITVLLPVYNAEAYLEECLDSLRDQTFADFEILAIDDGSTDRSAEILQTYPDPRIRYERNPENMRLIATLNKGLEMIESPYIARMDADDISLPTRLEKQYALMESDPQLGLCSVSFENFGDENYVSSLKENHWDIRLRLLHQFHSLHPAWMIRRSVLVDNQLNYRQFKDAEDLDLLLRIARCSRLANISEVLMRYRKIGSSVTGAADPEVIGETRLSILQEEFAGFGAEFSTEEIRLYAELAEHSGERKFSFMRDADALVLKMVEANRRTAYFPTELLEAYLGTLWYGMYSRMANMDLRVVERFAAAPLRQILPLPALAVWRLRLKHLLRR